MWSFSRRVKAKPWEPSLLYRVRVSTSTEIFDLESEKPISIVDAPDHITLTILEGADEGKITFYKTNLEFVQEFVPKRD